MAMIYSTEPVNVTSGGLRGSGGAAGSTGVLAN